MLEIQAIHTYYGGIHALKGVSPALRKGEIGANGAGKTVRNFLRIKSSSSTGPKCRRPDDFPQTRSPEKSAYGLSSRSDNEALANDGEHAYELFPILKKRRKQAGSPLSGGEQQKLATGRTISTRPSLVLLDELSLGLAPIVVKNIFEVIRETNHQGTAILLVEQNAQPALHIAHRGCVFATGQRSSKAPRRSSLPTLKPGPSIPDLIKY